MSAPRRAVESSRVIICLPSNQSPCRIGTSLSGGLLERQSMTRLCLLQSEVHGSRCLPVTALRVRIGGKVAECVAKPPQAAATNRKAGADQALEVCGLYATAPPSQSVRGCLMQRPTYPLKHGTRGSVTPNLKLTPPRLGAHGSDPGAISVVRPPVMPGC